MSNRDLKLKLWQFDNRCHWCKRPTKLINIPEIRGRADPLMATIDHVVSRYHPERYVKRNNTKVLACYECNFKRGVKETLSLSDEELRARGQGFSLNPRGNPVFEKGVETIDEVLDKLKDRGIIPFYERKATESCGQTSGCRDTNPI